MGSHMIPPHAIRTSFILGVSAAVDLVVAGILQFWKGRYANNEAMAPEGISTIVVGKFVVDSIRNPAFIQVKLS